MADDGSHADFDINILSTDALTRPYIDLTFPLPTDKDKYVEFAKDSKLSDSFSLLGHFIKFFSKINYDDIYSKNEGTYSRFKGHKQFNAGQREYMKTLLEQKDERLDEIVYKLIDLELRMNLIAAKDFPQRFKDVKAFMVKYHMEQNERNLPQFGSRHFIRMCYITVIKTLLKMFPQGVWVNNRQFQMLYQKYLDDPMSIVLLPNHQLHIDYVILHLILIRFHMPIPTVVAGENLNVAVFGAIMKGLGAIFIKRTFNNELYTERNLTNYIEYVFLNKIHFEVFIEGTRSRDGKVLLPKYGILKTLTSLYLKQQRQGNKKFDMLMQPISITYERIYEADGFLDELVGNDKKQESFVNILSNGVSNLVYGVDRDEGKVVRDRNGYIDNTQKTLHGKIFVKLADNFRLSLYVDNPANHVNGDDGEDSVAEQNVNLKKLGFKIMHAVNYEAYLPKSAIVGMTIQTYYYMHNKREFPIRDLLPLLDFLVNLYKNEHIPETNRRLLNYISNLSESQKVELIKEQVIKFFKFSKINPDTDMLKVENSFEILYYKNLLIHLIIHQCLALFILTKTLNWNQINKLFYIFTGFLKNEFLFDYNYNPRNELLFILSDYEKRGLINDNFEIVDREFHNTLATIIQPFIKSFMICVDNLNFTVAQFFANVQTTITEQQLINDSLMLNDYPTTKSLLRIVQKDNFKYFENENSHYHIETYNKQYLLSFLFYLSNLKLIKIFKNKAKTKAYVVIRNGKDLKFLNTFLQKLIVNNTVDDVTLNYMIDIVDKNFERDVNDYRVAKL